MSDSLLTLDKDAKKVKTTLAAVEGKFSDVPSKKQEGKLSKAEIRASILTNMESAAKQMDSLRSGQMDRLAVDISLAQFAQEKWGFSPDEDGKASSFLESLGINPSKNTLESLYTMPEFESGFRWIVPEVFREAIRLGLRKDPAYTSLIAAEETVSQKQVIMPSINMSDVPHAVVNEGADIPMGTISFNQKTVNLSKIGVGIKITDEVKQYSSLNILALYLQDVGVKMNRGMDTKAVDTLINGDGNANPATVVGVEAIANGVTYLDLLRSWIRMGRLGRLPAAMLSGESLGISILELEEFKKGYNGAYVNNGVRVPQVNLRTPVPSSSDYLIHGAFVSNDQVMLIDTTSALVKLNATALRVESERIAQKQIDGTYVTMTTGFANIFDDARLIVDKSIAFAANGFPAAFNVDGEENDPIKNF